MNPWLVLDVPFSATDEAIRAAWQRAVQQFPPDRDAVRFQEAQDAYTAIKDARARAAWLVRHDTPPAESPLEVLERYACLPGRLRPPGAAAFRSFLRACSVPLATRK